MMSSRALPGESANVAPARAALGCDGAGTAVEAVSFDFGQAEDVEVAELLQLLRDLGRAAAVAFGVPGEDTDFSGNGGIGGK